ncbi:tyrosine-type recombinase/integrase [Nocardioides pocheonensis]|uniref:Site-specific integrase n=1 Tax=Nocardioides pocheonensis TaxID=661485 RepID=A0A3N0GM46_9ACTN|nr:site-specific integrase [Nocardioides pocheonensis]RNM13296.1 site-specific integrase [Nocardioides pocheonensis]
MANRKGTKARFGSIRLLPSGRYQARYVGPDGLTHKAHTTFDTKGDAETWLATIRADIVRDAWSPYGSTRGKSRALTFGTYSDKWLAGRRLEARTRAHYRALLDQHILPTFAAVPLKHITPDLVRDWYATTGLSTPTTRAHAYGLLRTILGQAERDDVITKNPCHIRGAGNTKRVKKIEPATLAELETIVTALPERYRVMALLASWCGLRFGELAELRRGDVNTKAGVIHVRRGMVRAAGETIVKKPKSDAGIRDVAIPPHLLPMVREHMLKHAEPGKDGLLFPARGGGHLAPSSLYRVFYSAREAAGRPDLRWHDLRHTGAVLAAQTGATLAELMGRLGHSTPGAALRYQHAAQGRDMEIAKALSDLVTQRADLQET